MPAGVILVESTASTLLARIATGCVATLLLIATTGTTVWADDEDDQKPVPTASDEGGPEIFPYFDLRVGWTTASTPDVTEKVLNRSNGQRTKFEWNGGESYGSRLEVTLLTGTSYDGNGFIWGGQWSFGKYGTGTGGGDNSTTMRTFFFDAMAGYQLGIVESQSIRVTGEILPFVGVGTNWVTAGKRKYPLAYEAGIRSGIYFTERRWLVGGTFSYVPYRFSEFDVKTSDTNRSTITIDGQTFRIGAEAGYRF